VHSAAGAGAPGRRCPEQPIQQRRTGSLPPIQFREPRGGRVPKEGPAQGPDVKLRALEPFREHPEENP